MRDQRHLLLWFRFSNPVEATKLNRIADLPSLEDLAAAHRALIDPWPTSFWSLYALTQNRKIQPLKS
jgi:hypothetical protein